LTGIKDERKKENHNGGLRQTSTPPRPFPPASRESPAGVEKNKPGAKDSKRPGATTPFKCQNPLKGGTKSTGQGLKKLQGGAPGGKKTIKSRKA